MLKGIDSALSAELLMVLMSMGHGDDLGRMTRRSVTFAQQDAPPQRSTRAGGRASGAAWRSTQDRSNGCASSCETGRRDHGRSYGEPQLLGGWCGGVRDRLPEAGHPTSTLG